MGGSAGKDHAAQRAGTRLLRHGVRGDRQGHRQRRPRDAGGCQDGQRVGEPAREDRVPERSLGDEGLQLPPRGTTREQSSQEVSFVGALRVTTIFFSGVLCTGPFVRCGVQRSAHPGGDGADDPRGPEELPTQPETRLRGERPLKFQ